MTKELSGKSFEQTIMFSVTVIPHDDSLQVFLKCKVDSVEVQFPPYTFYLRNPNGRVLTSPDTGLSAILINTSHITFGFFKYDGRVLIVKVPNSAQTTASVKEFLYKWKNSANAMY